MLVEVPQGDRELNVTDALIFLFVLFVMKPIIPTVVPGTVVVGDTLTLKPTLELWPLTGPGTKSNVRQTSIIRLRGK